MAKKKEFCIEDSVAYFKEVMNRLNASEFIYLNKILSSETNKEERFMVVPDQTLWMALQEDQEFKSKLKEFNDLNNKIELDKFQYGENLENGWLDLDAEKLYNGEVIRITISGFNYDIEINKGTFLVRLKKAEYNNFSYKIDIDSNRLIGSKLTFRIKKVFEGMIPDTGFTIIRAFYLI